MPLQTTVHFSPATKNQQMAQNDINTTASAVKYSANDYLEKGLQILGSGQEKLAVQTFERGLQVEPTNIGLLKVCLTS